MDGHDDADARWLKTVLLAHKTRSLALPESTQFEPLRPRATAVPVGESEYFATHTTYQVPIDIGEHVRPGQSLTNKNLVDVVHRFSIRRRVSVPMSERLTRWALHKERLAKECEGRLIHVAAGRGSDAGGPSEEPLRAAAILQRGPGLFCDLASVTPSARPLSTISII